MADQSGQTDGTAVYQWHTPAATEHTKDRGGIGNAHVTPAGKFKASCNRVSRDGCMTGLSTCKREGPWAIGSPGVLNVICFGSADSFQIGAGTKRPVRAGQNGDLE